MFEYLHIQSVHIWSVSNTVGHGMPWYGMPNKMCIFYNNYILKIQWNNTTLNIDFIIFNVLIWRHQDEINTTDQEKIATFYATLNCRSASDTDSLTKELYKIVKEHGNVPILEIER